MSARPDPADAARPAAGKDHLDPPADQADPKPDPAGQGADIAWSAVSSLLSGPLVWGAVGFGLDHLLGTRPICLVIGLLLGGCLGFWIVYSRFGRDQS